MKRWRSAVVAERGIDAVLARQRARRVFADMSVSSPCSASAHGLEDRAWCARKAVPSRMSSSVPTMRKRSFSACCGGSHGRCVAQVL